MWIVSPGTLGIRGECDGIFVIVVWSLCDVFCRMTFFFCDVIEDLDIFFIFMMIVNYTEGLFSILKK